MALEIRSIPVLTGEDAERFIREAEENERNPQRRKLLFSFEDIDRMMERSRKYLKEHGGKGPLQNRCGGIPYPVTAQGELESFSCGDDDLDDFFHNDASLYAEQLLGKTYYFATEGNDPQIVCAFTLANDSIKAALIPNSSRNKIQRKIPNSKRTRSYPAVLIGRLGVSKEFQGKTYLLAHKS